ncbi:MAG: hypothetical protein ACI915_000761 [Gammaproteobacteria bacterium]|jgi:hypothetical protein
MLLLSDHLLYLAQGPSYFRSPYGYKRVRDSLNEAPAIPCSGNLDSPLNLRCRSELCVVRTCDYRDILLLYKSVHK